MGDDEIETKSRDMFNDMMTIERHFENAGYRGDTVILGIKELAEFIRFYQPAALAPVDVEGMKIEGTDVGSCFDVSVLTTSDIYENGWNDCIDHLAARGCLGVPEGYVLLPINPTREAVCQRIAISFDEDCAWRGNVVKTMGRNLSESRITVIFTPSQLREIYGLMVKAMLKAAPKKEE